MARFKRILLKVSGEALAGDKKFGYDYSIVENISGAIKKVHDQGIQVAVVVGGGNFFRGRSSGTMDRTRADHIGMLATVMNSLTLADALEAAGLDVRVQTAISMQQIAEPYIRNRAVRHLEKGRVVVFGCGTGNPFFSTDTASALRAAEIGADVFMKATMADGVYDKDPNKYSDAVRFDEITFQEVLARNLQVMDATATALCKDNNLPILVFSMEDPENIVKAVNEDGYGTLVHNN